GAARGRRRVRAGRAGGPAAQPGHSGGGVLGGRGGAVRGGRRARRRGGGAMDWLTALQQLRTRGEAAVLVTVVEVRGHAPREAGAGLLGPVRARTTVVVFGIGHVGYELARILARLPVSLHLVDSRAGELAAERLADVTGPADVHVHHAPAPEVVLRTLPPGSHVLVMTHDHAEDLVLCDAALRRGDLASVGLIGSRAKWARFRKRLLAVGHDDAAVATITC